MRSKRNTPYDPPVKLVCQHCGATFVTPAAYARRGRRYCGQRCRILARVQTPNVIFCLPFIRNEDGCRLLVGTDGQVRTDYVDVTISGRQLQAHRIAWEIANQATQPDGLIVRHLCPGGGNPACIEAAHLAIGTHQDNRNDAVRAGRAASGDRNGARIHIERMTRGEHHPRARLTEERVREILTVYVRGDARFGVEALARTYGVGATTIRNVVQGRRWTHVTSPPGT